MKKTVKSTMAILIIVALIISAVMLVRHRKSELAKSGVAIDSSDSRSY